jgi:hypothetical protein
MERLQHNQTIAEKFNHNYVSVSDNTNSNKSTNDNSNKNNPLQITYIPHLNNASQILHSKIELCRK